MQAAAQSPEVIRFGVFEVCLRTASLDDLPRPLGAPRPLTHGESAWHVHNGGWSPDGKALVYTRDFDNGGVYVIENYR